MKVSMHMRAGRLAALVGLAGMIVLAPQLAEAGPGHKKKKDARMTGGGSVFTTSGVRVTHGFQLRCDASDRRQNLQINWEGNRFHLTDLTSAFCFDDPDLNAGQPSEGKTPVDSFQGVGEGRYNGDDGAEVRFLFTDDGEPGTDDFARIRVFDDEGNLVLEVAGTLEEGNHQVHAVQS